MAVILSQIILNPFVSNLNVVLAFFAALLGFPAGIVIAHMAKEELDDARKYLMLMQHFLFVIALILLLYYFGLHYFYIFIISLVALFVSMLSYVVINNRKFLFPVCYTAFAIIYFLSARNIFLLVMQLSIIFLFGLATGSLFAEEFVFGKKVVEKVKKKTKKKK